VADFAKIKQLEAQIAADQQRYSDIERVESKLSENIPLQGFSPFSKELKYRSEKEALGGSIKEAKQILAELKKQHD
jgi:hypothetical protein